MAAPALRTLPNLKAIFERETHASLYFDAHASGTCYLAIGARRSFTWDGTDSDSLSALQAFCILKEPGLGPSAGWGTT